MSTSFRFLALFVFLFFAAGCGGADDSAGTLVSAETETSSHGAVTKAPSCAEDTSADFVACAGLAHGSKCLQESEDIGECAATARGACRCEAPVQKARVSRRIGEVIDG